MPHAHQLTRKQWATLVILTLVWGINWPILKIGITHYPAITFRSMSILLGWVLLSLVMLKMNVSFRVPRKEWGELFILACSNMFVWHVLMILAVQDLSSGRAAILGYSMPIFSAVIGMFFFKSPLLARAWLGVALAALGAFLLLWHELVSLTGKPLGVLMALAAAAAWGLGTQQIRHTKMTVPTLTSVCWMTGMTTGLMLLVATVFESDRWAIPPAATWGAILYNAVGIFVFAQSAWLWLARSLPPLASTLSVMLIPVLGVFSGAWWLGEVLHWQDWLAVVLIMAAIASVLWPTRSRAETS